LIIHPTFNLKKMSEIKEIEKAVKNLTKEDLSKFREWFASFDAEEWDRQFEFDVNNGKLDKLAAKALAEHDKGKTGEL